MKVHFLIEGTVRKRTACGNHSSLPRTTVTSDVTCLLCRRSPAFVHRTLNPKASQNEGGGHGG